MTIGYCFRSLLSYVGLRKDLIPSLDSQTYSSESSLSSHSLLHVTHQKSALSLILIMHSVSRAGKQYQPDFGCMIQFLKVFVYSSHPKEKTSRDDLVHAMVSPSV